MVNIVADVLTVKDSDSRPTLEMSIDDINSASSQPTSDTQFTEYEASEFDDAERIEFHMDHEGSDGTISRVVDGREATWDGVSETVSVDLLRSDTARQGQHYFEWVLIYDSGVTDLANATEVNTVPDVGFYGLTVEDPTARTLAEADSPDRNVGHIWLGEQSDEPTDTEIGSGNVALYARTDDNIYIKPHGGSESQVGTGSAIVLDLGDDGSNESTDIAELATSNDANGVVANPSGDKVLIDLSNNVPGADTADGLSSGALDAIGEIDAALRSGADATLITGTIGSTDGNVPEINADGDLVDSGQSASDIGAGAGVDVENTDGVTLVSGANPIQAGTDLDFTDDTDGSVTLDYTGASGSQKLTDTTDDNDDGGDIYELPADADSIRARFDMNLADTNQMAREDRPLFTSQARTVANGDALKVDPSTGNDANDGFTNPLETLDEAFHRIPIFVQHPFDVSLAAGTYTTAAHSTGVAVFSGWQRTGTQPQLQFIGDRSTPSNVVVEGKMGVRIYEAETDDTPEATFSGITFEDEINNKGGVISFSDCRFTGAAAGAEGVINGKAAGLTNIIDSEFFDGFNYVFNLNNIGAKGYIENCTGSVAEYTFRLQRGATGYFIGDSEPVGEKGTYLMQDGAVMIDQDGQTLDRYRSFGDDFNDARYRGFRVSDSRWFRPEWTIQSGSPIANDGYVHFPDGSTTTQELHLPDQHNLVEDIVFDVRFNSTPSTGQFRVRFNYDWNASGDYYQINLQNDGDIVFSEDIGGFASLITGTYPQDTDWHTIRASRADNGDTSTWELWVNQYSGGGSEGTGSDTGVPDRGTNTWRVAPRNTADAIVEFRNLSVNHFSA